MSWKEQYWEFRASLARIARLLRSENRPFARAVLQNQLRYFSGATRPIEGETLERADAAAAWLARAQDATVDDGVSVGYFPCETGNRNGWRRSYPETTGYIIATLLDFAERYCSDEMRERALRMAIWETEVQMPSGAVQAGPVCDPGEQVPAVFNTGMVLQGYTAALRAGAGEEVLSAARRAADFLVADMGKDGHFQTHGSFVTQDGIKTYNCLCAWALYRFWEQTDEVRYRDTAIRSVEAAAAMQQENGWFASNCLTRPEAPLLHTIGYTLQGILEVGLLAERDDLVRVVRSGTDPLLGLISPKGFIRGRFRKDWKPAGLSACLTGNAQLAIVCYRLFEKTGEQKYREAADRLVNFLKAVQILDSPDEAINGAIAGSYPILGSYMTTGYPNWATKYFLDSLMVQDSITR